MQNVSASLPNRARETTGTDTLDSEPDAKGIFRKQSGLEQTPWVLYAVQIHNENETLGLFK